MMETKWLRKPCHIPCPWLYTHTCAIKKQHST